MSVDLDRLALEAEAGRLSGVYLKVALLAKARRLHLLAAGREAVAAGLVRAADWELVKEAITGRWPPA